MLLDPLIDQYLVDQCTMAHALIIFEVYYYHRSSLGFPSRGQESRQGLRAVFVASTGGPRSRRVGLPTSFDYRDCLRGQLSAAPLPFHLQSCSGKCKSS